MKEEDIIKESHQIWEELGPWWDASVEDGDCFHRAFVFPTIEKLLELKGSELVLDAGCGNGALSRYMANKGAEVFGIDFSSTLIKQAQHRSQDIKYEIMDLTDKIELEKLSKSKTFDRIVCSMVLHDMPNIRPFFESLQFLIKPKGSFIFSIPHPCFNNPSILFEPLGCLTVKDYIQLKTSKFRSKPGQPIEQLVFHRPVREYFNLLIAQGMVMNGFEEPCVDPRILPEKSLWAERPEIPPALISRWGFPAN
ncbi:MAG TPA: class I SAM-dependent methyltransferase [Parachlamydiaceae bacterium]|nr:class I SAM-dependent methyltransferase [Parachlamydiaceae bacterium]